MRVLFCKFHCPFICFCKPSPHLYTAGPLKLENGPRVPGTAVVLGTNGSDNNSLSRDDSEIIERKEETVSVSDVNNCRKSSMRKPDSGEKEVQQKRVQWMDFMGKELAEIREFESSEVEDPNYDDDDDDRRSCVCVIL